MEQGGFLRTPVAPGVTLHVRPTGRFKSLTLKAFCRAPLAEAPTATALVPLVLRRGTRRYPSTRAISQHLEGLYGARLGADVVKVGETQVVDLRLEVVADRYLRGAARGQTDQLGAAIGLLNELLWHPVTEGEGFKQEYVRQERETLRRRLEGLINNKRQYAVFRCFEEMCKGEPFAVHRYGRLEDLEGLDARTVHDRYRQLLGRYPLDLFVMGDVDPERLAERVRQGLEWGLRNGAAARDGQAGFSEAGRAGAPGTAPAAAPAQASTHVPAAARPPGGEPRTVVESQPVKQSVLVLGCRTAIGYADDRYPSLLMYNGILGGFPHSKLFVNVRERASLAYFAYSRLEPTKRVLVIGAGIDESNFERALAIIRQQMEAMRSGEFSDAEMEATRKGIRNGMLTVEDDPPAVIDGQLVGLVNGRFRSSAETIEAVERVTREQIVEAAQGVRLDTVFLLRGNASGR